MVVHSQNERSFHIMYMIYAAMKEKYGMERCEECIFQVYINSYLFIIKRESLACIKSILYILYMVCLIIFEAFKAFSHGSQKV